MDDKKSMCACFSEEAQVKFSTAHGDAADVNLTYYYMQVKSKVRAELLGKGWHDNVPVTRSNFPGEGGATALLPGMKRKAAAAMDGGDSTKYKFGGDAVAAVISLGPVAMKVKKEKARKDDESDDDGFMELFSDTKVANKTVKHLLG
ncbi:unnamed protein product [Polarella glacialis]|uniref:Uncharacterized protein n=1 Tax=Polarella glacialis TaxID=89957 RepID=A0A813HKY2_POLGL|nr:unnamed protein product [Polarella glacialis]